MKILIEVEEDDKVNRSAECEVSPEESVDALAKRIAGQLGLEAEELVADLGVGDVRFEPNARVGDYIEHGKRWRHRRVCIDLRFESESNTHRFPAHSTWARVRRWGCKHFHVSADACINLELREGSPTGPPLNESSEIGVFTGCKTVWLVKPGPEPNGATTRKAQCRFNVR